MQDSVFPCARRTKQILIRGKLFNEARAYYDSAMVNWKRQNERFIFFRDYEKVLEFATLTAKKAIQATENSLSSTSTLKRKAGQKIDSLNKLVSEINKLFTTYPLESEIQKQDIERKNAYLRKQKLIIKRTVSAGKQKNY